MTVAQELHNCNKMGKMGVLKGRAEGEVKMGNPNTYKRVSWNKKYIYFE